MDADTGEIVACVLTDNGADDAGEVPALLGQVEGEIASVTADGAYDGEPVYHAATSRQPDRPPDVVIPPRSSAVASTEDAGAQSQRDRHIRLIAEKGRMAWQKATGYGRRSHAETPRSGVTRRSSDRSCAPAACRPSRAKPPSRSRCSTA